MLDLLRTHGKKILTGLLCAIALGSVGMAAYERSTSCCSPGAACCYPGSPCCHGHADHRTAAR
jgi:hypothetical protein